MGIVVHDTARDRGIGADDYPVVERGGEDLHVVPDTALVTDARVRPDQDIVADCRTLPDGHRADNFRVSAQRDRFSELHGSLDLGAVARQVADDIGECNVLQFPAFGLAEGMGAPDIGPVAPCKPAPDGISVLHQGREKVAGKIIFCARRDMVKDPGVADVHPGTCKV